MRPSKAYTLLEKEKANIICLNDAEKSSYLDIIKMNARESFAYAKNILNARWPEAEAVIMQDPHCIMSYIAFLNKLKVSLI